MLRAFGWLVTGGSLFVVFRMVRPPWRAPGSDLRSFAIRLSIQTAVPLVIGFVVGDLGGVLAVGAVVVGLAGGTAIGASVRISTFIWIVGVVVVQAGALLSGFAVLELGLAVCWFSAALTAGRMISTRRGAIVTAALISLFLVVNPTPPGDARQEGVPIGCPGSVGETTPILDADGNPQFAVSEYPAYTILSCPYAVNWQGQVVDPDEATTAGVIRLAVQWFNDGERHECESKMDTLLIDVDDGTYLEYTRLSPTHQAHVYVDAKLGWAVSYETASAAVDALLSQAEAVANPCVVAGEPTPSPIPLPGLIGDYYLAGNAYNEMPAGGTNNVNGAYFSSYRDDPVIYRYSSDWWVSDGERTPPPTLGCGTESTEGMNGDWYEVELHSANSYAMARLRVEGLDYAPDEAVEVLASVAEAAFGAGSSCVAEEAAPSPTTTTRPQETSSSTSTEGPGTTTTLVTATPTTPDDQAGSEGDIDDTEAALSVLVGFMGLMAMAGEAAGNAAGASTDTFTGERIEGAIADALETLPMGSDMETPELAGLENMPPQTPEDSPATDPPPEDQTWDGSDADGSDFMYTETAEQLSGGLQSGIDKIDSLSNALDELGIDGDDRDNIDGYVDPIKDTLGSVKDNVDLYQSAVEGAAEIVDDTERELDDYDVPRQVQDGIIYIRWMLEAGGEYLQDAVDTYLTPLTSRLADWFGGEASDYSRQAVPVDETSDELSDFVVKGAQLIKGGRNYYGQDDGGEGIGPSVKDDLKWEFNE